MCRQYGAAPQPRGAYFYSRSTWSRFIIAHSQPHPFFAPTYSTGMRAPQHMTTSQANAAVDVAWRLLAYALGGGMILLFFMYVLSSGRIYDAAAKNSTHTN